MKIPYVSPSRLKTGKECEFKYFLHYEWGWSDILFQYAFSSEFGTSIHATLEAYAKAKGKIDYIAAYKQNIEKLKPFAGDMSKAPSKARGSFFVDKECESCPFFSASNARCGLMDKHVDHFDGCPKKLYDEGLLMIENAIDRYGKYFRTGIKSAENPKGKIIGIECPADISWGPDCDGEEIKMNGYIDLLVEYDKETILIVDYKTGYSVPSHDEFITDLQPRMYSYAVKRMYPQYKYHWVQFDYFRGIPMEHAFIDDDKTRQDVADLFNRIKTARKISRRGYDHYCKYRCNRPFCDQKWEELKLGIDGSNPNKMEKKREDD